MINKHEFEAHKNDYKLIEGKDIYGCLVIFVYVNGNYQGFIDCMNSKDFEAVERNIREDKDYIYSMDVYA
ncbi:TPA: hypothetical protein PB378_002764 [Staphylococcus aureus]|uniref:hypothetical protein n=1 Tax=Staphylococcus aureus TaxID=1280 RepID=UPI0015788626|nr:hypothetical protein [Staphylococcus aureus]MBB2534444.1 hypothetical protein [Staphylococcus aureus]CAC8081224.1 Uncharacterised protein [Staphylococcus aureus]HDD7598745.1 hypothetical protein [Staphylococcus aureus]HDE0230140.1 hypothetical protein [Staphylococcus aureus]HDE0243781.1 hypothetical protein [Staphylococcus aureus]